MPGPAELIPGTAIPITNPQQTYQPEGRGTVTLTPDRQPVSMIERLANRDDVTPSELMYLDAAIRAFNNRPPIIRRRFLPSSDVTDATTGNLTLQLFEVPMGSECHLASVTIDTPQSATIFPGGFFSSSTAYAFLAKAPPTSSDNDSLAAALRPGMVAFAPTASGGPFLPGQWAFDEGAAPVGFGGEMFYFVLVGASVAALTNLTITAKTRINEYAGQGST